MKKVMILATPILIVCLVLLLWNVLPLRLGIKPLSLVGGFSIDTPERAENAATDGVQVSFGYGRPPDADGEMGQKLESLHMKVVDGFISGALHYYECHRTKLLKPELLGPGQYCKSDPYPYLANDEALLAIVTKHLQKVKDNPLVVGYWVLDDWVQWDAGHARPLLEKIHALIQQYTPGRPAICGFGGTIEIQQKYGWEDWIAANYSPQACDQIGLYLYSPSLPNTTPTPDSDSYDWSMSEVLPAMLTSLQARGWDSTKVPMIGIGQAFGGSIKDTNKYRVVPTAENIEKQSRSFCEHGATGLAFYAWNDAGFGAGAHTPMNSPEIEVGIQRGIAACKAYTGQA